MVRRNRKSHLTSIQNSADKQGQTKFILEDPEKQAAAWVEAFQRITEDLPEPAGAYLSNIRYTQSMDLQEAKHLEKQQRKIRKTDGRLAGGEVATAF